MNKIICTFITVLLGFNMFVNAQNNKNVFSATDSILLLKTTKHKGFGLIGPSGVGDLYFINADHNSLNKVFKIPHNIDSAQIALEMLDLVGYYDFKKSRKDTAALYYWLGNKDIDITGFTKHAGIKFFIAVLKGKSDDSVVLIVDQNNNLDFTDDTWRSIAPIQRNSTASLIPFRYEIFNDSIILPASSWINIGVDKNGDILNCISQHVSASFFIDDKPFTIVVNSNGGCFDYYATAAVTEEDGKQKDTLLFGDILQPGEYLKLGNQYYRFHSITKDGTHITLIKEEHFAEKTGTQIGMIAPDFSFNSIDNDTVSLGDYKGKYLLIINVTACWSRVSSYKHYKDLTEACAGNLEFLGIDYSLKNLQKPIEDFNLKGKFVIAEDNNLIQYSYRPDYSSRVCYLINRAGRIESKFEIGDWEEYLGRFTNPQL
ncbi:MAG: hypothetical protein JXQ80_10475 [Bacteroidales bacterium]|nr:hypothetical protein [Bacteroidales bacterium]